MLLDTHFHLDFVENVTARVQFLDALYRSTPANQSPRAAVVAQTLLPEDFLTQLELSEVNSHPALAGLSLGLHPWNICSPSHVSRQLELFSDALPHTRFIGEVGLDFSPRRLEAADAALQCSVLRALLKLVHDQTVAQEAASPSFVVSLHAVRAVGAVLDVWEEGIGKCGAIPVIHWFSGTSDELTRLIKLGGYISVNPRMLETKRGRAYVVQVPAERLLLETDMPHSPLITSGSHATGRAESPEDLAENVRESLIKTLRTMESLRSEQDLHSLVMENSKQLYQIKL